MCFNSKKTISRSFKRISSKKKTILIKKRFLGKATGHNDHFMINMSDQRPKIGIN